MLGLWCAVAGLTRLVLALEVANETIWSSVIYTYYGDRTPLVWPVQNVLTSLGAQQLYSAGSYFRRRYLGETRDGVQSGPAINKISTEALDNSEIFILSSFAQYVEASAIAFMQGLYPPTNISLKGTSALASSLINVSMDTAPLGGYQYPQLLTASPLDPTSILIDGQSNCRLYYDAMNEITNSEPATSIKAKSEEFYHRIQSKISTGDSAPREISFDMAYYVFDYINYGYVYDKDIHQNITTTDLAQARDLANQQVRAFNGYSTSQGSETEKSVQTIAGQSLATEIVRLLWSNFESGGVESKLNLLFGSYEPIIAFSVLSGLARVKKELADIPNPGSSMVLEMFTDAHRENGDYPSETDLRIRFLFRNGTDPSADLVLYPLFDHAGAANMTFDEFLSDMQNISISSPEDWCTQCDSKLPFCAVSADETGGGTEPLSPSLSPDHKAIGPAVAGVIGAIVALAAASILFALLILIGGVRFHRDRSQRRCGLGRFRAGQKLTSDQNVPASKNEDRDAAIGEREDRVNSWELREQGKENDESHIAWTEPELSRKQSCETEDMRPYHSLEPTKAVEGV